MSHPVKKVEKHSISTQIGIVTALGATIFILTDTFGSGSYVEAFWFIDGFNKIHEGFIKASFFTILAIFAVAFGTSVYILAGRLLNVPEPKPIHWRFMKDLFIYSFITLIISVLLAGYFVISVWLSTSHHQENTNLAFSIVLIVILVSFINTAISYLINDILKTDWLAFAFVFLFLSGFAVVLFNQYRDAEKAAFVNDAEFCYWSHVTKNDIPPSVCHKFNNNYSSYRVTPVQ